MLGFPTEVAPMKTAALLAAASILLASTAFAPNSASAQSSAPPVLTPAPPPPGMNAPAWQNGADAAAPPRAAAMADRPNRTTGGAGLPSMQDPDTANDGKHMNLPEVSRRQDGENQIEEYRRSGMLYMVVVTPRPTMQQKP
ncbi:MAG: hypothetical protein WDW36_004056 [Sanguina aurantia]